MSSGNLPKFRKPPVVEVAISVQFEELPALHAPQLGLLWGEYRRRYPRTEQHPPIARMVQGFGPGRAGSPSFQLSRAMPVPRCWFINDTGTRLVQVQPDRFIHNWRRTETPEEYPDYDNIRAGFLVEWDVFIDFLDRNDLGTISIDQVELTYQNHIPSGTVWTEYGQLGSVIPSWSTHPDPFLGDPERVAVQLQYVMSDDTGPVGRLGIQIKPEVYRKEEKPLLVLALTARGAPEGEDMGGALRFLDRAHEWIVRGFTALTSPEMHKEWERYQ